MAGKHAVSENPIVFAQHMEDIRKRREWLLSLLPFVRETPIAVITDWLEERGMGKMAEWLRKN